MTNQTRNQPTNNENDRQEESKDRKTQTENNCNSTPPPRKEWPRTDSSNKGGGWGGGREVGGGQEPRRGDDRVNQGVTNRGKSQGEAWSRRSQVAPQSPARMETHGRDLLDAAMAMTQGDRTDGGGALSLVHMGRF